MKKKNKSDKHSYILTKETLGMTLMLFCILVTIMLITGRYIFGGLGSAICTFMYGTFGYASYFVVFLLAYLGEWLAFEKKLKLNLRAALCVSVAVAMFFVLFHAVSTAGYTLTTFGDYINDCYHNASEGYGGYTAGGVISGLLVYPVAKGVSFTVAYVMFALLTVLFAILAFFVIRNLARRKAIVQTAKDNEIADAEEGFDEEIQDEVEDSSYVASDRYNVINSAKPVQAQTEQPVEKEEKKEDVSDEDKFSPENLGRKILFEPGEFAAESYRRNMIYNDNSYFNHPIQNEGDYMSSFADNSQKKAQPSNIPSSDTTYTNDYSSQVENRGNGPEAPSYLYGDAPVSNLDATDTDRNDGYNSYTVNDTPAKYYGVEDNVTQSSQTTTQRDIYSVQQPTPQHPAYEQPVQRPSYQEPEQRPSYEEPVQRNTYDNGYLTQEFNNDVVEDKFENDGYMDDTDLPEADNDEIVEPIKEEPTSQRSSGLFNLFSNTNPRLNEQPNRVEPDVSAMQNSRTERSRENLFDDDDASDNIFGEQSSLVSRPRAVDPTEQTEQFTRERGVDSGGRNEKRTPYERVVSPVVPEPVTPVRNVEPAKPAEPKPVEEEKPKHIWKKYIRPSLELLDDYPENNNVNTGEIEESKRVIVETLASFRIASQVANVIVGPAITRYDVIIEDKTNIKNALKYREAVAMALMKENVTAYLNYSKGAISIEVPNSSRTVVGLKGMLASSQFLNAKPNSLTFTLGKNVEGTVVCPDITKMPHLLVAGTTGSGKSICLSTLIISLLYKYGPEELRFILVDPKQVEFISYDKLPHLMINEIIYDVDKAIKALNWAIKEMERRYQLFKEMTEKGVATKNLTEYNAHLPEGEEKLPKIVIILDEFGDLMLQAKKDIESRIIRLVQKARACGIHLILATQRPSVDCITGLIKSNLPTRIGFKVNSFDDARTIFDIGGAEKLLGKGDMYFRSADNPELARIQGCFIDTHEVQRVTDFIKQNNETYFDQSVSDFINTVEEEQADAVADDSAAGGGDASKVDDTFIKALKFCVTSNQASVSMIQRRFPIGYMKACKIIDWMETMNYITQSEGSKPRKVLLSREEFIQKFGDVDD